MQIRLSFSCHQFQELNTLKNKHKQKVKGINSHASKGQVSCHRVSAFPQKGFRPSGTHPDYPARKAGKAARLREGGLQKADGLVSFLR